MSSLNIKKKPNEKFLVRIRRLDVTHQFLSKFNLYRHSSESKLKVMSEQRDRLGQWPQESESEFTRQGLQRLKNGRLNKVRNKSVTKKR